MTEQTKADAVVRGLIKFPKFLWDNAVGILIALLTDFETFAITAALGIVAVATGSYLLVGGIWLLTFAVIRTVGLMVGGAARSVNNVSDSIDFHGQVIRDNWQVEHKVSIEQMPTVTTVAAPPIDDEPRGQVQA